MDSNERQPTEQPNAQTVGAGETMRPGDQAPVGTPGTGLNVCRTCGGSGRAAGAECATCAGTGTVVEAIGGGG
jgi:DnaJ-class molecular chaperone